MGRAAPLVVFAAALGLPAVAGAEPSLANDVYLNRVDECPPERAGVQFLTTSSHVLYVNDCLPNGCAVTRGQDSSLTDTSSIASANTTMSAWTYGPEAWATVMDCVKANFAMFDIEVTDVDPGTASHFEVMVGGTSFELSPSIMDAGGIAPSISCNAQRNNSLAFVFAAQTSNLPYLCNAITHEAGHMYGLSHSLDARDPMTYMQLSQPKSWTNAEQMCGTDAGSRQQCRCFQSTNLQNSFRYLKDVFGLKPGLAEPSLVVGTPKEGMYVKPGFPISATYSSPVLTLEGHMALDGGTAQPAANGVFAWNAPATIGAGDHSVTVAATDYADRVSTQTINVKVMSSCTSSDSCDSGFACLGGFCLPGRGVDGGLGATCEGNNDCSTSSCASDGTNSYCTAQCDPGNSCPSGFTCIADANQCWPVEDGGCSTSGSPSWLAALGLVFLRRRRRT
ncbi:MAG: MYXO-CTERM sorting domain-containing protein [Kofleriaceae bacterium]